MTTAGPTISVLLPVRNGGRFFHEALASVLLQDHPAFEVLVVDDGSTDRSAQAAAALGDPRVRVLSSGGRGLAAALNLGLEAAAGRYIARQDADDCSLPRRFRQQAAFLDAHPDIDVLGSRVAFIDAAGAACRTAWTDAVDAQWDAALDARSIAALLPLTCCLVHGSVMARRETLARAGGYRTDLPVAQDYDLWLRLLPGHRFARLPERLYAFRLHAGQTSAASRDAQTAAAIAAKLRYLGRVADLRDHRRATILGQGRGVELYRDALGRHGFAEVGVAEPWDIAVFTDFAALERDMTQLAAVAGVTGAARIGNFLVRPRRAA